MNLISTSQITDGAVHYVCVDEIDVRTEADTPEPPPVVDPDPGDCVNLAAGRPYTSAWAASGSYADDGGQLTDGVYSRALSCKAPEWVGYYNEVQDGFEFIVDLGESKRFEQVKMNFLREEGSGIPTPYSVRIELSDDSASWRTLTQTDVAPIIEGSGIKRFVYTVPQEKRPEAQARYVKLHINFQIWLFIDEIEIFDRETPDQGTDVPPDDQRGSGRRPCFGMSARAAVRRARHDPDGQCDGRPCLERLRLAELQRHKSRRTRRQPHSDGI